MLSQTSAPDVVAPAAPNSAETYQASAAITTGILPSHAVRIAYLIPANRTPQPNAVANLRSSILLVQQWYRDQMSRNGFGQKTFQIETEADGVTPMIHVVNLPDVDSYYRADDANNDGLTQWNRVNTAASAAGIPLFASGQVWLNICESYVERPDGSIIGGPFLGSGFGSGSGGGVAMITAHTLSLLGAGGLTDITSYNGRTIPTIGPYPLVQDVSFPWFEGSTYSAIASSHIGGIAHEIGHGFGLPHDFRNDNNFRGDLMGNGLRGFRGSGAVGPAWFNDSDTFLSRADAQLLNVSRYFNVGQTITDNTAPTLAVTTPAGSATPVNGSIQLSFNASDAGGLSSAMLLRNGDTIGEMPLSGTSITGVIFRTPIYDVGTAQTFGVSVLDLQGNRTDVSVSLTPASVSNRAPQPFVTILPTTTVGRNQASFTLDASQSSDPDNAAGSLLVEWDVDGDGIFDTAPTTMKTLNFVVGTLSEYTTRISARLTDPAGAQSVSSPIAIRVSADGTAPAADITDITPDPRSTPVSQAQIVFSEPVFGLDVADLQLTRNGSNVALSSANAPTTADNLTFTIPGLSTLTAPAGSYVLKLAAAGSNIVDPVGNPLAASASDSWSTNPVGLWTGLGDGSSWEDHNNWAQNVLPGPADDVVMDVVGNSTIVIGSVQTVHSITTNEALSISGSLSVAAASQFNADVALSGTLTGNGDNTFASALNWTAGTMSGSGKTIIPTGASLSISGLATKTLSRSIENKNGGLITWTDSDVQFIGGGVSNVGTFNISGTVNALSTSGANTITNSATINVAAGAAYASEIPLTNAGTVNASGFMAQSGGGSATSAGVFNVPAGGDMRFIGNSYTLPTGSTLNGAGTFEFFDKPFTVNSTINATGAMRLSALSAANVMFNQPASIGSGLIGAQTNAQMTFNAPVAAGSAGADTGGRLRFNADVTCQKDVSASGAGTLTEFNGTQLIAKTMTAENGGIIKLLPSGSRVAVANSITATGGGSVDLTNNAMIVRTAGPSAVQSLITSGFNGGAWNGAGINSSSAAADPNGLTALGYASNADMGLSSWMGVNGLTANDVLVRYTYYGDADLDGAVTLDDFSQFLNGYQTQSAATNNWLNGDFDYDGAVTLDDFSQFLFGDQHQGAKL